MPVTKVGIRYSKRQEVIRSIFHFDRIVGKDGKWHTMTPEEIADFPEVAHLAMHEFETHPLEKWVTIDHATYHNFKTHQEIHEHLGLRGKHGIHDRCAVVDDCGNVIAVTCHDPDMDRHPDGRLIQHATAVVGDKL